MQVKEAVFITSSQTHEKCPPPKLPEYAFIGRSNVGKSSLINTLTNKKHLAKTSGKPGKTQLINHFKIDDTWFLVDLPGYGWAQVNKKIREGFDGMIRNYIALRPNLCCTFILIDSRHSPQANDLDFMRWMGTNGLPFVIIFTKADKLKKKNERERNLAKYLAVLQEEWEELPQYFVTSAESREGMEDILRFVMEVNGSFKPPKK